DRRGAPAEINAVKPAHCLAVDFHFSEERLQEIGNLMEGGCGIKVTVAAFAMAEGDVDVKTGGAGVVQSLF
ncbi:MAG: hypothetical protein Q7J12_06935, partial [Syntrophales bacterium]|nr:hypothetical protein [Syntrophales bacterium]